MKRRYCNQTFTHWISKNIFSYKQQKTLTKLAYAKTGICWFPYWKSVWVLLLALAVSSHFNDIRNLYLHVLLYCFLLASFLGRLAPSRRKQPPAALALCPPAGRKSFFFGCLGLVLQLMNVDSHELDSGHPSWPSASLVIEPREALVVGGPGPYTHSVDSVTINPHSHCTPVPSLPWT